MPADPKLFFKEEVEGCVPLTSPGEVERSTHHGSEGLTTPCLNIIWCNANACFCKTLIMQHPSSISKTSDDGIDWAD